MIEIGTNLYHTAALFIIVWGITRCFVALGQVAVAHPPVRKGVKDEPINFTK